MKILRGGSAETANGKWVKFDVELDESDLQRILIEHELVHSGNRLAEKLNLTVGQVFQILEAEAEMLVTLKMQMLGIPGASVAEHKARLTKILDKLKANEV